MDKNKIKEEISYKYLEESELPGISRLIKNMKEESDEVLKIRDNSINYYDWMYFKNPAGNAIIASAWHKDILVSTFAMAPKKMRINGKEYLIGKTMDMFTDPKYQGLGIISKLTKMVFEESLRRGLEAWYVTPSTNSYPIFKNKWNYIEPFEIEYKYNIINIRELAKTIVIRKPIKYLLYVISFALSPFITNRHKFNPEYQMSSVSEFNDEFNDLWTEVSSDYENIIVRNYDYLNWRYIKNPDEYLINTCKINNILKGYIVSKVTVRKGVKTGEIVDLLYKKDNPDIGVELIKYATQELYQHKCALVEAWDHKGSTLNDIFINSNLSRSRTTVKFLLSPECTIKEFYNKKNWYLTQSDGNDI